MVCRFEVDVDDNMVAIQFPAILEYDYGADYDIDTVNLTCRVVVFIVYELLA